MNKNISKEFAQNYDSYSKANHWSSPTVLFELCHQYLNRNDILLDIGIGTGLSAVPFKSAGLIIYGLDSSEYMLDICRSKQIAIDLKLHDLIQTPFPYDSGFFDICIVNGILHLTGFLEAVFSEIKRILKNKGLFAFTIDKYKSDDSREYLKSDTPGLWKKLNVEHNFYTYKHSISYVDEQLKILKFSILDQIDFCAFKSIGENREVHFTAFAAKLDS